MNTPKDLEVASPPEDSSTCVRFSPASEWLACSSFDGKTRVWEIQQNGSTIPKAMIQHDGPALGVDWLAVLTIFLFLIIRMDQNYFLLALISKGNSWIWLLARPCRSPATMLQYVRVG